MPASAMTVRNLAGDFNRFSDLKGTVIGTISGSSAESFLKRSSRRVIGYPNLNDASVALVNGNVMGVYDSPMLHYFAANHSASGFVVVGPVFENQDYGFVFNLGSQLRKEVNATLVKLKFSGYLEQLKTKWFSSGSNQIRMHFSACSSILFLSFF